MTFLFKEILFRLFREAIQEILDVASGFKFLWQQILRNDDFCPPFSKSELSIAAALYEGATVEFYQKSVRMSHMGSKLSLTSCRKHVNAFSPKPTMYAQLAWPVSLDKFMFSVQP